jgi:hypothetical protein
MRCEPESSVCDHQNLQGAFVVWGAERSSATAEWLPDMRFGAAQRSAAWAGRREGVDGKACLVIRGGPSMDLTRIGGSKGRFGSVVCRFEGDFDWASIDDPWGG